MRSRCYYLDVPGQYQSWLAIIAPIKDRDGWEAMDISYRAGEEIPSITYLPIGEADLAPYSPITPQAFRLAARHAMALVRSALEVASEDTEVTI